MFSLISPSSVRCFHSVSIYSRAAFSSPQHSLGSLRYRKIRIMWPRYTSWPSLKLRAASLPEGQMAKLVCQEASTKQSLIGIIGLSPEKSETWRCFALQTGTITALQAAAATFQKNASVWTPPAYIMCRFPSISCQADPNWCCGHLLRCCRANVRQTHQTNTLWMLQSSLIKGLHFF